MSIDLSIPVFIEERAGLDRPGEMLVGGMPLSRGQLTAGGWFTLRFSSGTAFTVEGTPAAYWPDGSIKWLHLCGPVDLAGGKRNEFRLECGETPAKAAFEIKDRARRVGAESEVVSIHGEALEVEIQADEQEILSMRYQGRRILKSPGLRAELVLVGPNGEDRRRLPLSLRGSAPQIVSRSANRVVVRLAGHFRDTSGREAGELILFIEIFRQSAEIRLQPVFIYLGDPERDLIASLTLTVESAIGGPGSSYGFANETGRGYWDVLQRIKGERLGDGPIWPMARQIQLGSSFYMTQKRTSDDASWTKAIEGQRSQGWCHLSGPQGNITAAMRYFWQEYPHSLAINTDRGTITFGLIPPEAAPLDLRRYATFNHGMVVYETGKGPFPQQTHGARGIAKAFELMIRFDTTGEADTPQRGQAFANPVRILTDPKHLVATQVFGQIAASDPQTHRHEEDLISRTMDFLLTERHQRGWYGLMDFGDIIEAYREERGLWSFDEGGYGWINSEALPDLGLLLGALRSGRADWLEPAIEMMRHNRDVDMYHRGLLKGIGTRHNVNHWGDYDKEWRISMPLVRRFHYYLTADPWTAEVIRETVAVYQSYSRVARTAPSMTAVLAGIYAKWEMTGSSEDAKTIRNFLNVFADAFRADGQLINSVYADLATGIGHPVGEEVITHEGFFLNSFGGQQLLVELAEEFQHERLLDGIVRHVDYIIFGPESTDGILRSRESRFDPFAVISFLAGAYRRTGNVRYRDAIRRAMADMSVDFVHMDRYNHLDSPLISVTPSKEGVNKFACELASLLHLMPYGLAAV